MLWRALEVGVIHPRHSIRRYPIRWVVTIGVPKGHYLTGRPRRHWGHRVAVTTSTAVTMTMALKVAIRTTASSWRGEGITSRLSKGILRVPIRIRASKRH